MKNEKIADKSLITKRKPSQPPSDLDPSTDVSSDLIFTFTSCKNTTFPIYGAGNGYKRASRVFNFGEIIFATAIRLNKSK